MRAVLGCLRVACITDYISGIMRLWKSYSRIAFLTHEGDTLHAYCSKKGGRLDAGIALAHLFVANEEHFAFFKAEKVAQVAGYDYIASFTL